MRVVGATSECTESELIQHGSYHIKSIKKDKALEQDVNLVVLE